MNTDRELKILRATGIEGLAERFETMTKYEMWKVVITSIFYFLMILALVSLILLYSFDLFMWVMMIALLLYVFGLYLIRTKKNQEGWKVESQRFITLNFLGVLILIAMGLPVTGIAIYNIGGFSYTTVIIFAIIGLLPFAALPAIMRFAKKHPLTLWNTFDRPYSKEEFEKILRLIGKECGEVKNNPWNGKTEFLCEGLEVSLERISTGKGYRIKVRINKVDENTAPRVKSAVEKIERILAK